jgi:hypothetical protein
MVRDIEEGLKNAYIELENAQQGFEYAVDKDLVDYFTLKITASQKRYNYYLKKARDAGIKGISLK